MNGKNSVICSKVVFYIYLETNPTNRKGNSWIFYGQNGKIYHDVDGSSDDFPTDNVYDCFQRKLFGLDNFLNGNHAAPNCDYSS